MELILENTRMMVDETAEQLNIKYFVVHDSFWFHKMYAGRVHNELMDKCKHMCSHLFPPLG
jgi:hypothetical protein